MRERRKKKEREKEKETENKEGGRKRGSKERLSPFC